jgi:predicted secreted Zn-dependent protease
MFTILLGLAGAVAQGQAATPATPATPVVAVAARGLKDLPGATVSYYDITGKTIPEIQQSLKAVGTNPATKDKTLLYNWDVGANITKRTTGTVCTVVSSKSTFSAKVNMPRLVGEESLPKPVVANWRAYVGELESQAASDLWFIRDRLPRIEQSMANVGCDQAAAKWNSGLDAVKTELNAKIAARSAARASAAAAAAAAAAAKPAKKKK